MEISHKVKYINNVAYVHIYVTYPDEYEFALDFDIFKKNVSEVSTAIKKYIRENFDKTKGFTFVLILNGLIVGTVLSTEMNKLNENINEVSIEQSTNTETTLKGTDDNVDKETSEPLEDTEKKPSNLFTVTYTAEEPSEENTNTENNVAQNTAPQTNSTNKGSTSSNNTQTNNPPSVPQETGYSLNLKLSSGQVIKISLEEYVIGVVGSEMPASFNSEALKAQSVAARTYALKKTASGATISATTSDQIYKTNSQLQSMWGGSYNTYYNKVKNAVNATKGVYMTYGGNYIESVYFSTSNGRTEDAVFVWGNSVPYLKSVASSWDVGIPSYSSSATFTYAELSNKLGVTLNQNSDIKVVSKTTGNRVKTAIFGTKELTGVKVRSSLGLRSADFDITKTSTGVTFSCRGYGHGVGMSQYGANGMANAGYSYKQILQHYYTGISFGTK